MCKCGLDYQTNILYIDYSNQHFEPIEYTCDVRNTQLRFETQPMLSKPTKQEVQTLAKKMHFHWNDDLDYVFDTTFEILLK